MQDLTGQTLGGYQIVEQIGRGGMATVFRAYQPSLDRDVAIKVLPPYYAEQDESFLARFKREARAIAKLRHPNILMVMDFGQENDLSYIVMEYINAGTLKDYLQEPILLKDVYDLTNQIASALQYAHDQGVVHRDVKPTNIMMPKPDWALLTDFGLARMVGGSFLTQSGMTVGTPAYMSPEQGSGDKVDHRSDIYSLGVMLYEMTVGEVPYTAETPMAVVVKHIVDPLPLPRAKNSNIPEELQRVILKALAKNPDDRYQQISEIPQALKKISQEYPAWSAAEMPAIKLDADQPETAVMPEETADFGAGDAPPLGISKEESSPETVAIQPEASEVDQAAAISPKEETIAAPAKQKRRLWPFIVGGVALLAILGGAIFWWGWASGRDEMNDLPGPPPGEAAEMPGDHQGQQQADNGAIPETEDETIQQILILLAEGNRDRAGQILRIAVNRNPDLWDVLISRVEQMAGSGNFEEAARLLSLALETRPDTDAEKFIWSGYLYFEAGFSFEANLAFREALSRAPFMAEAHDQFVSSAIEADIVPEAIAFLEDLSETFPDEYLIYSSLGELYLYQGEEQMAIDAFERALSLDPKNPIVLMSMANAYYYMDRFGEAIDRMNQALEIAPDDPIILGQAGYLYLDLEDDAAALRVFEQAHELEIDNAWISLGYAEAVYYSGGDIGQVNDLLRSVEESARADQDIWLLNEVGWLFLDMDNCQDALQIFNFVEEIAPGETDAVDGIQECN